MTLPVRPGMTLPLPGHLHAQREKVAELADLGYTDVWSAESDGADAFTPLAMVAAWEPRLRLGTAIVPAHTRAPACPAQSGASIAHARPRPPRLPGPVGGLDGRRRPGPLRHRHRLVLQRDRGALERRPLREAL